MRIVLVVGVFPATAQTFIVNKVLRLRKRGLDVHVVTRKKGAAADWAKFPELSREPGRARWVHAAWPIQPVWLAALLLPFALVRCIVRRPRTTLRYLMRAWTGFHWKALIRLYYDAEILLTAPDVVHFEFGGLAPRGVDVGVLLGCPVVVSFRGYDISFVGLEDPHFYDHVWETTDAVHVVSHALWERALRRGCPKSMPHVVIPSGVDTEFFTPDLASTKAGGPPVVLSVGRLVWKKGHEYALESIALLRERGVKVQYRIVGSGSYAPALQYCADQLGLGSSVEFLGSLSHEEVRREMQQADLLLHAAVSEGFPNVVVEAQAMELPVVCSDADGLPEAVEHGVTGLVAPRRDPEELADLVEALLRDAELRVRMGSAARQRALLFKLDDQIDKVESFYQGLCQG